MADKKITELDLATTIEDEASFIIAQTESGQTKAKRTLLSTIIAKLPFYRKPAGGIPASDLANGVIPDTEQATELTIDAEVTEGSNNLITSGAVYDFISSLNGNEVSY